MADVELRAGITVDLASGAELREQTEQLASAIARIDEQLVIRPTALLQSDAGGLVGSAQAPVPLWRCPENYSARIYRWGVGSPAASPAAPITTGELQFYTDAVQPQALQLFLPVSGVVAPVVLTDSRLNAVYLGPGESLVAVGDGLPASTQFGFNFTITLYAEGKA